MGALTLKPFSNELREWELIEGEALDPTDCFGVSLRLSLRENQIYLAEPNDPNFPWITDKARLFFDGMFTDESTENQLVDWDSFFQNFSDLLYFADHLNFQTKNVFSLTFIFENLSVETLNILYLLQQSNSLIRIKKSENYKIQNDLELKYQLTNCIQKPILAKSNLALLLNINPRYEGYLLNLNLRQRFLKGNFKVLTIGPALNLTYPSINLGSNLDIFKSIAEGIHIICQDFKAASFPVLVTNTELFKRNDFKLWLNVFPQINSIVKTSLNVLNHNLNSVGINTLYKFLPLSSEDFKNSFSLYFINVPMKSNSNLKRFVELYLLKLLSSNKNFFVPNTFIDQYENFDNKTFITKLKNKFFNNYYHLPSNLFLEESETFVNTQGIIKRTTKLLSFKKNAKSNWEIIRKIYIKVKSIKFFNQKKDFSIVNFDAVNSFSFKNYLVLNFYATQTFTSLCFYLTKQNNPYFDVKSNNIKRLKTKVYKTKLKNWLDDFFSGNGKDSFSYNSSVLMNCSKILRVSSTNFF